MTLFGGVYEGSTSAGGGGGGLLERGDVFEGTSSTSAPTPGILDSAHKLNSVFLCQWCKALQPTDSLLSMGGERPLLLDSTDAYD